MRTTVIILGVFFLFGSVFGEGAPSKVITIPKKINIAVLTLKNTEGVAAGESELLTDRLRGELFNTGSVNVMERNQMKELLKEQALQESGACSDEACLAQMGQLLGVEKLVTGSIGKIGTMYLINIRVVDVKTAQISRVVSRDIKGGIEDMVVELRSIAFEIVAEPEKKDVLVVKDITNGEPKKNSYKEEKKYETQAVSKPETKTPPPPADVDDLNKNRSGIRVSFNIFAGKVVPYFTDSTGTEIKAEWSSDMKQSPWQDIQTVVFFKIGQNYTLDLGTGFQYLVQKNLNASLFYWDINNFIVFEAAEFTGAFAAFPLMVGVNYVKHMNHWKINLGVTLDYLIMAYVYTYQSTESTVKYEGSEAGGGMGFGGHGGIEYLLGSHFGINLDLILKNHSINTSGEEKLSDAFTTPFVSANLEHRFVLPKFGTGLGLNFYF